MLPVSVRQCEAHVVQVRLIHFHLVEQPPHAARLFRAEQMTLARMPAHDFAGLRGLEALGGAAMRLELHFLVLLHNVLVLKFLSLPAACRGLPGTRRRRRRSAFLRREQREQDVCFHPRPEFHLRVLGDFVQQARHLGAAHVLVSHFAAAMKYHRLHFVPLAEEADDLILPHLKIVLGGGRTELYFLDVRTFLVLFRFMRFFVLLVEELPVVDELADRRHSRRRDFHNVQAGIPRRLHRVEQGHHSKLIPCVVDHADFASANALVHPQATTRSTPFCDKPTSRTRD